MSRTYVVDVPHLKHKLGYKVVLSTYVGEFSENLVLISRYWYGKPV